MEEGLSKAINQTIIRWTVRAAGIVCAAVLFSMFVLHKKEQSDWYIYTAGLFLWATSEYDWLRRR